VDTSKGLESDVDIRKSISSIEQNVATMAQDFAVLRKDFASVTDNTNKLLVAYDALNNRLLKPA
jgi:hypothetical protein